MASPQLDYDDCRAETPRDSIDHLPIASRFLSPTPFRSESPKQSAPSADDVHKDTPNIDGDSVNSDDEDEAEDRLGKEYPASRYRPGAMSVTAKHNHPRSPYGTTATRTAAGKQNTSVPFPSRSHQSLPPPSRTNALAASTPSLSKQSMGERNDERMKSPGSPAPHSTTPSTTRSMMRRFKKSTTSQDVVVNGAVSPTQIPEDLRICLEVIEGGILDGHIKLSEGLRKRYEEQYPLVRSLADVFVSNVSTNHSLRCGLSL